MFRYFTHHLQEEHRITCSKPAAIYDVVVLCFIGYVMEHKINIFIVLQCFLQWFKLCFVFVILYVENLKIPN
jgi:hypothetical protein